MTRVWVGSGVGLPPSGRCPDEPVADDVLDARVATSSEILSEGVRVEPAGRVMGEVRCRHPSERRVVVRRARSMRLVTDRPVSTLGATRGTSVDLILQRDERWGEGPSIPTTCDHAVMLPVVARQALSQQLLLDTPTAGFDAFDAVDHRGALLRGVPEVHVHIGAMLVECCDEGTHLAGHT